MKRIISILCLTLLALGLALYMTEPKLDTAATLATASVDSFRPKAQPKPEHKDADTPIQTTPAAPQPEAVQTIPGLNSQEAASHWGEIAKLISCMEGGKCEETFPSDTPSSQYFAIRDRMLAEVEWFKALTLHTPTQQQQGVKAAHSLLSKLHDEMLQLSVLEWLQSLPSDPETPLMITKNLRDVVDVELVQAMVKLFVRDRHPTNEAAIDEYVFLTIDRGATLASIEMAKSLPELLTQRNRSQMQKLLNVLPKNTERERHVRLALFGAAQ